MFQIDFTPRILVVDDDEIIREGIKRLLTKEGYEVVEAENGSTGLEILMNEPFHVVLLDLEMPDRHGLDVLQAIVKAKLDVTAIMITGHGTIEDAVTAIKLGAYDFITKPFMPDHLKQVIGRVIELRRLEQERDLLREERQRGLGVIITEKNRLKAVINSMNEGVLITELDKRIVMCNPSFARIMHIPHHHLVGFTLRETPELHPLDQMADELLQNVTSPDVITKVIEINENHPIYVRISLNRVAGKLEETLGLVIVLQDITYFKELEQKKSEFVSMVAHELKAPWEPLTLSLTWCSTVLPVRSRKNSDTC
jgi:PAS domain S-box-containing protein